MDDSEIVSLFMKRDENAISETLKKYRGLCFGIAKNILRSETEAEECLSDAMMALWSSIPPQSPENFRAYLCRIVRNQALTRLDYLTADKRLMRSEVSLSEFEEFLPDGAARDALEKAEFTVLLDGFLSKLRTEERKIFVRRYFFCDTVKEISEHFKISESKTKSMLMRTRKKLKEYLTVKEMV